MPRSRATIGRPLGPRTFCTVVLTLGLLLLALPLPQIKDAKLLGQALRADSQIALVGPSVIDTVSPCDEDRRTIADLLAAATGKRVADLSEGGQPLSDEINIAATAGRNASVKDVVLPIAPASIDEWTTPPYSKLIDYKVLNPNFKVFGADSIGEFVAGLSRSPPREQLGFSFGSQIFPDYRTVAATEFAREKRLTTCPERATHNPAFTRGYYWWMDVAPQPNPAMFDLVAALDRYLAQRGRRLHVVLLPLNVDLLRSLSPAWAKTALERQARIASTLSARGVEVLDLTDALPRDQFITAWCACTHFNDRGRTRVAQAIAASIRGEMRTTQLARVVSATGHGL